MVKPGYQNNHNDLCFYIIKALKCKTLGTEFAIIIIQVCLTAITPLQLLVGNGGRINKSQIYVL